MLKHCWPTCSMVYNHRGWAMKFWLLDIILKLFAPVMEMHCTTNTGYGWENWITTSKFKISVGDKWCLCLGWSLLLEGVGSGLVPADTAWFVVLCLQQPELGSGHSQWHCVILIPLLCSHSWLGGARVTLGKVVKSTWVAWSVLSLLSMTRLLRSPSPNKDNVLCLPVQPIASENFTIKNPGWWRFAGFIRLWWLLFAFLLFFLLPTHSNLNFLDHFSSVNSHLLSCKPPCTITVRV